MRWLICLSLLIAVHQCRHLSEPNSQSKRQQGITRQHGSRRRNTDILDGQELTEYQPVVVKLEVHFAPATASKRRQLKRKKIQQQQQFQSSIVWKNDSRSSGFIHLFLPFSVSTELLTTTTTTSTPASSASIPAVSAQPETMVTHRSDMNKKKKRKKKKKKRKKQQKIVQDSSNTMEKINDDVTASVRDQRYTSPSNRLMPLLSLQQDDGIPPMLNSLSSDETQQWARWLRCTLCLKNDKKQSDEESALCQNVECRQANVTAENELTTSGCQETDTCSQWQRCENGQDIPSLFEALPPCPCTYPTGLVYNDRVWDPLNRHYYRWREISLQSERVDIYRPGAAYCIRSLSVVPKMTLSSQQCCYDDRRRLLTRGWAAGTPALVSPEASAHLSRVTERLPWLACKGDFSRYHLQRPPDNRLNCTINPSDEEYQRQVLLATNY